MANILIDIIVAGICLGIGFAIGCTVGWKLGYDASAEEEREFADPEAFWAKEGENIRDIAPPPAVAHLHAERMRRGARRR